jgi:hypothetical protein
MYMILITILHYTFNIANTTHFYCNGILAFCILPLTTDKGTCLCSMWLLVYNYALKDDYK